MNRVVCAGLVAASVVGAEGAHAAKGKSCEDLFAKTNQASKEKTIPVPDTRVTIGKPARGKSIIPTTDKPVVFTDRMSTPAEVKKQITVLSMFNDMKQTEAESVVLGERRSLLDYLNEDPNQNIAIQSPLEIMNAAQRMLAFIYSEGKSTVRLQLTNEPIEVYKFFSGGPELVNGFRIWGGEKAAHMVVTNLKAQSRGDRSASSIPLLVGSHGTGKSETLKLLNIASEKLTAQAHSKKFAVYTYNWTNLGEIAALRPFLTAVKGADGVVTYADVESGYGSSPFTLMPPEVQDGLIKLATPKVEEMLDGATPLPFRPADPASAFIRNEIIQNLAKKLGGRQPGSIEIVQELAKYVVVKRQIIGQKYGRMPLIDKQDDNLDGPGLFMAVNPVVRYASGAHQTHPMGWNYGGKILASHGNAGLFDEYFRNPQTFRDMMLSVFESRKLSTGGSPTVEFDSVMIAATNTASIDEVASTPGGQAAADRFKKAALRWLLYPNEVAQLLLSGKQSDLYQQDLNIKDAPITRANIDDLIPRTQGTEKIRMPDYRYRLFYGTGPKKVLISPHTILLMSEIIAATRMELSPEKTEKEMGSRGGKYIGSHFQKKPIDRLRLYEGMQHAQPAEIAELVEARIVLKEGESGISARDAGRWFSDALEAASSQRSHYTLTPGIALEVFRNLVISGEIQSPSTAVRLEWLELEREIRVGMLMPRLQGDFDRALGGGDRIVKEAYYDVIEEMMALKADPNAVIYRSRGNNLERSIDHKRLRAIKEFYQKVNGRPLNFEQIAYFHAQQSMQGSMDRTPDEELLDAIARYVADINTRLSGLQAIVEYATTGSGTDDVQHAHRSLSENMKAMGYNDVSIHDSLMLIQDVRNQSEAPSR